MLKNTKILWIYTIGFIMSLHVALPTYINSTFLSKFLSENLVGLIYTVGSVLALIILIILPRFLKKFGNFKISILVFSLEVLAILALALTQNPIFIFISMVLSLGLIRVMGFNIDIFLESKSSDEDTGGIRGFFLSIANFAWVISPILAAFILGQDNYFRLYLISSIVALPILLILIYKFRNFKDPVYDQVPFLKTLKTMFAKANIKRVVITNILLRFFYSWMVIYTPIYLHDHIGFEWSEIGIIFTVMLVPFILLEAPLGKIADEYLGEKEILSLGFFIIATATAFLSFIDGGNLVVWAIALFLTRVGASMIEIMSETYFFKKIDGGDSNVLSVFRMTGPLSYIVGPAIATVFLYFIDIQYLFLILGIIMLMGLHYSLALKDTL
jgi:MFS family permease